MVLAVGEVNMQRDVLNPPEFSPERFLEHASPETIGRIHDFIDTLAAIDDDPIVAYRRYKSGDMTS